MTLDSATYQAILAYRLKTRRRGPASPRAAEKFLRDWLARPNAVPAETRNAIANGSFSREDLVAEMLKYPSSYRL